MKNKIIFIIAVLIGTVMIYSRCKKEEINTVTINDLQGEWSQDYNATPNFTMPPNYKFIQFKNDSFYMQFDWSTEILTSKCPQGKGTAFVKGKFKLKNSKLYINGIYTTPNYDVNTDSSGCLLVGSKVDSFLIKDFTEQNLILY